MITSLLTPLIIAVTSVSCINPPKNTAVVQGSNVTFSCSTDEDNLIRWDFYPHRPSQPTTVYNGRKVADNIDKRISVDIEGCLRRTCDLSVVNVSLNDAGYFVCFEAAKTTKYLASLTVLGSTPECRTNLSVPDHSILVEDYLRIDCRVDINGSWTPSIECSPNYGSPMEVSKHGSVVTSSMTIAARLLDRGTVFTCMTSFNGTHPPNSNVQHASVSTNVPEYQHQWRSQPVQVQDRSQSTSMAIPLTTVRTVSDDSSTESLPSAEPPVSSTPYPTQELQSVLPLGTLTTHAPFTLVVIIGLSLGGLLLLAIVVIIILVAVVLGKRRTTKAGAQRLLHSVTNGSPEPLHPFGTSRYISSQTNTLISAEPGSIGRDFPLNSRSESLYQEILDSQSFIDNAPRASTYDSIDESGRVQQQQHEPTGAYLNMDINSSKRDTYLSIDNVPYYEMQPQSQQLQQPVIYSTPNSLQTSEIHQSGVYSTPRILGDDSSKSTEASPEPDYLTPELIPAVNQLTVPQVVSHGQTLGSRPTPSGTLCSVQSAVLRTPAPMPHPDQVERHYSSVREVQLSPSENWGATKRIANPEYIAFDVYQEIDDCQPAPDGAAAQSSYETLQEFHPKAPSTYSTMTSSRDDVNRPAHHTSDYLVPSPVVNVQTEDVGTLEA